MDLPGAIIEFLINMLPLFAVIYTLAGIKYLWAAGKTPLNYFALMMFACAVYSLGYYLEATAMTPAWAAAVRNFEYLGIAFVPTLGLLFIIQFTGLMKIRPRLLFLLAACSLLVLGLYYTDSSHHLFYRQVEYVMTPYLMAPVTVKGPGYLIMFGYYIVFLGTSTILLFMAYRRARQRARVRSLRFLLIAFQLPWLTVLFISMGLDRYVDPTPLTIVIMCGLFAINEIKNDMFQSQLYRWHSFYDGKQEPAFLLDAQGQVSAMNQAGAAQLAHSELAEAEFFRRLDQAEDQQDLISLGSGSDTRWFTVEKSIYDPKNILNNYGLNDITNKILQEEQLVRAKEQAEEASLLKSRFLANMSHELRTPMHGVLGYLDLLKETGLNYEQLDYVQEARNAGNLLLYIINDILDFSKIEAGKLKMEQTAFSLSEVIDNAVSLMMPSIKAKGIGFQLNMEAGLPEIVEGDPARLQQILHNLIGNAVKFTAQGLITLDVSGRKGSQERCILKFRIKDTGVGIPPEAQERLFQPFVQADVSMTRKYGGTGLGLAITRELIRLMEGEISVDSEPGVGTEFIFEISLAIPHREDHAADFALHRGINHNPTTQLTVGSEKEKPSSMSARSPQILMVEDNASNRILLQAVLRRHGWEWDVAENGLVALQAVSKKTYDVILMDCQMPQMDGYECTKRIREMEKDDHRAMIIAMTADVMEGTRERCLAAGMDLYLSKPIDYPYLLEQIEKSVQS